jgi:hypothetical protein
MFLNFQSQISDLRFQISDFQIQYQSRSSTIFQPPDAACGRTEKRPPQFNVRYPGCRSQQFSRNLVISLLPSLAWRRSAKARYSRRVNPQINRLDDWLTQNRVESGLQLTAHLPQLPLPDDIFHSDHENFVLKSNRNCVPAQRFANSILPRGDAGGLSDFLRITGGCEY